ncbi:tetraacyldisaccharide 4'-kinase [Aliarcobacter skirrowii]|uniref:Tetraacyldisaccharide 4'-kinase n=1 Tax=Aliarcobacter skirrowii CCUG 10374 TaxID=1032239 RepID=A0AAD0SLQ5_9BACT|nr:tetraacyldisaccharide 4'-kinase [Aliarcobacter skirrowii]AXX84905.1 tetraacyldisaccharide 4'-kinase [Aliarcobacter skirrowii CCUG 10374]KAB0620480.1 tetraacyldisaccharide 4'-kinase [Aliarcobacter skirrowii CCUG 10374]RXI25671.1 tetraacyldisaccharide 4'-kinase [Aliarcobacter skirrowii CCUG 10374]SUU96572.1 Tetraacyldisaccharide 4'-kinase [Aliarcobacter skirrowii]
MKQKLILWLENYLFFPNSFQKILSYLLLPLSFIYLLVILFKRLKASKIDFNIPIISVGNLTIGGSGKTPITIELAKNFKDICVILRGYGRESKGLFVVSLKGEIKVDVKTSGDEAMLLASTLKNATIIVSEDRVKAIKKAKELGCKIVFLDDGFSKYNIKKFDILLKPKDEPTNSFLIPSGAYREPKSFYKKANLVLKEDIDFKRVVTIKKENKEVELPKKTILLTAISKPNRLLEFLPKNIETIFFEDHHNFTKDEIDNILNNYRDFAIVTTQKDFVKLEKFNLKNLYIMDLSIKISQKVDFTALKNYIKSYN